jgi:hypothetical protein
MRIFAPRVASFWGFWLVHRRVQIGDRCKILNTPMSRRNLFRILIAISIHDKIFPMPFNDIGDRHVIVNGWILKSTDVVSLS